MAGIKWDFSTFADDAQKKNIMAGIHLNTGSGAVKINPYSSGYVRINSNFTANQIPERLQPLDLTQVFGDSDLATYLSEKTPKRINTQIKSPVKNVPAPRHTVIYEIEVELSDEEYKKANAKNRQQQNIVGTIDGITYTYTS